MAGLDKILGEISETSDSLVKDLLQKAHDEANAIKAQAEKEAEDSCARIFRESDVKLADVGARAKSAAELARRQLLLQEKQNLIKEVTAKAEQRFKELPDSAYFEALLRLIGKNALPRTGAVMFNKHDRSRLPANYLSAVQKAAQEKGGTLTISDETREIDGGFVLLYDGVEQNCSISALFETNEEVLQDKIQSMLFDKKSNE